MCRKSVWQIWKGPIDAVGSLDLERFKQLASRSFNQKWSLRCPSSPSSNDDHQSSLDLGRSVEHARTVGVLADADVVFTGKSSCIYFVFSVRK